MGDFDDVLAMEPGDEWDDHVVGVDRATVELAELRATLRLPNASVELRGDVPDEVLDAVADLTRPELIHLGAGLSATLTVGESATGWALEDLERGQLATGSGATSLLGSLVVALDELALLTDPMRLHLDAACVVVGGQGVLVTECAELDEHGAGRPARHTTGHTTRGHDSRVEAIVPLLDDGAQYVAADLLSLLPGSGTVFAHPVPVGTAEHPHVRVSTVTSLTPVAHLDQVVLVDQQPGSPAELHEIDQAEAVVHLLHRARDLDRFGPGALDAVAHAVRTARCWRLTCADPSQVAPLVADLPRRERAPLTVVHRFDERVADGAAARSSTAGSATAPSEPPPDDDGRGPSEAVVRGRASLRVVRFDEAAALFDGASGTTTVLAPAELDALESLLVPGARGTALAAAAERLERLTRSGIALPVGLHGGSAPGVESFGLPNCPAGRTASGLWGGEPNGRIAKASGAPGGDAVPGAVAEAIERDLVAASDDERRVVLEAHRAARTEVAAIESALLEVLDITDSIDVVPLVLGAIVLAHDGLLPSEFVDAEQIDLLVAPSEVDVVIDALSAGGFGQEKVVVPDIAGADPSATVHELTRAGDPAVSILVHTTLAVGPFGALVNHEEFHERSVPFRFAGRWARSLHPEDRFVLACVQLDLDDRHSSVQDLRDVVLSAPRVEALMAESLEASERWGATTSVISSIRQVDKVMPGISPWLIERASRYEGRNRRKQQKQERKARRGFRRSQGS